MVATHTRTNVMFADDVLEELRRLVPARERSAFVTEATRRHLLLLKQKAALATTAGVWSDADHADLKTDRDMAVYRTRLDEEWAGRRSMVADDRASYNVSPG